MTGAGASHSEESFERLKAHNSAVDEYWASKTEKELRALKLWLFSENVRIESERKKLLELQNRFLRERHQFQEEMKLLNRKISAAQQRLKQDEQFFEKKMQILQNGFKQLEEDRHRFNAEKREFEKTHAGRSGAKSIWGLEDVGLFFIGITDEGELKKRYRDLMKIYHPDNGSGDKELAALITKEYERIKHLHSL